MTAENPLENEKRMRTTAQTPGGGEKVALRAELETAVLEELRRVGPTAFEKMTIARRFLGQASQATLYRWVDAALAKAGSKLAGEVVAAAEARATRTAEPSLEAARQAVTTTLPWVPRVEDTAGFGGTVPAIEQLGECIRAAQQVMAYARHADGNVRSAKILLTATEVLRRSLDTAVKLQQTIVDVSQIERFHAAVVEAIREESPTTAERLLVRLQQLNTRWGLG
jgi:hypothetical protein